MIAIGYGEKCPYCDLIVTKETDVMDHLQTKHKEEFLKDAFNHEEKNDVSLDVCYKCDANAHTPLFEGNGTGVIFIRAEVNKKWQSVPICKICWDKEYPDKPRPSMIRDVAKK